MSNPMLRTGGGFSQAALSPAMLGLMAGLALGAPGAALGGELVVATHHVPVGVLIQPEHLEVRDGEAGPGFLSSRAAAVGMETRVTIYKGRPIRMTDLGPPTLIQRNAVVSLVFRRGALSIHTEGRALDRGALGDRIRIMNIDSRRTVFATVAGPNLAEAR